MSEETKVFEAIVRTKPAPALSNEPEILLALTGEKALQVETAEDAKIGAIRVLDSRGVQHPGSALAGQAPRPYRLDELEVLVRPFC